MPKKIALLEHDFSIERGELTPTLKVKRRVIDKTYKALIDALYAEGEAETAARSIRARRRRDLDRCSAAVDVSVATLRHRRAHRDSRLDRDPHLVVARELA